MAKERKPIVLPIWMKKQCELLARTRLENEGISKSSRSYQKKHDQYVQDFAHEAYTHSLTSGEK